MTPSGKPWSTSVDFKPYQQGQLDSLCGLYSIANAIRWGLREIAPVHKSHSRALNRVLIEYLEDKNLLSSTVAEGLTIPNLGRLLKTTEPWLLEKKGAQLCVRKPFHIQRNVTRAAFVVTLNRHLAAPNTSAIVLTTGRLEHWTVVTAIDKTTIQLSDSLGLKWFSTRKCTCAALSDWRPDRMQIVPAGVFLLTFTKTKR